MLEWRIKCAISVSTMAMTHRLLHEFLYAKDSSVLYMGRSNNFFGNPPNLNSQPNDYKTAWTETAWSEQQHSEYFTNCHIGQDLIWKKEQGNQCFHGQHTRYWACTVFKKDIFQPSVWLSLISTSILKQLWLPSSQLRGNPSMISDHNLCKKINEKFQWECGNRLLRSFQMLCLDICN